MDNFFHLKPIDNAISMGRINNDVFVNKTAALYSYSIVTVFQMEEMLFSFSNFC